MRVFRGWEGWESSPPSPLGVPPVTRPSFTDSRVVHQDENSFPFVEGLRDCHTSRNLTLSPRTQVQDGGGDWTTHLDPFSGWERPKTKGVDKLSLSNLQSCLTSGPDKGVVTSRGYGPSTIYESFVNKWVTVNPFTPTFQRTSNFQIVGLTELPLTPLEVGSVYVVPSSRPDLDSVSELTPVSSLWIERSTFL